MARKIAIFGAGGFGREVLQIIHDINSAQLGAILWEPVGFIVEPAYVEDKTINGLPILGSPVWLKKNPDVAVVIAVGSSSLRWRISTTILNETKNEFATLVHPKAWLGENIEIGKGTIVCAGALITVNIKIGEHVHVNGGSTVGHDAVLNDYVTLNPSVNVSGNVEVGSGVEVGTGTVIIPHVEIGEWSIAGAGSVITRSLPPNITAVGAPAKVIKQRQHGWQEL